MPRLTGAPELLNKAVRHVEHYLVLLVKQKNAGSFVDIPINDHGVDRIAAAIAGCSYRLIRKPLGNRNNTFGMSHTVNPGFYRVTLRMDMP